MPSEFAALARTFFDETLQDSPVLASQLGIDGFDDQLDDLSEAAFDDRRRNIQAELAPSVYVDRAIRQARAGARYFGEVLPREIADERLRAELADWGGVASGAMDVYAEFLHDDLLPRATGQWAIGRERYSCLLREKELLQDDATSLRERGRREYERLADSLRH